MISQKLTENMWNPFKTWNPFRKNGEEDSQLEVLRPLMSESQPLAEEFETATKEVVVEKFEPAEDNWTRKLRKVIRRLLIVLLVLVPIFILPFTIPSDPLPISKQLLVFAFAFLALTCWLVIIIRQGGVVLRRSGLEIGVLAILGAILLGTIFSVQQYNSLTGGLGFITWLSLTLILTLFSNFFDKKDIGRLVNYFLLGSFLAILSGILGIFGVPVFGWLPVLLFKNLVVSSQFNTIGSLNTLGGLAVLSLILAVSQYFLANVDNEPLAGENQNAVLGLKKWFWVFIKVGLIVVSAASLLIINWWGLYLILAVGMLAVTLAPGIVEKLTGKKVQLRALNLMGPLIILVLALLFVFGGRFINLNYPNKDKIVPEVSLPQQTSFEIFKKAFNEKPVFGIGPENFYIAYDQYRPVSINSMSYWNTRFANAGFELINLAIMNGVVGLAGFIALLYFIFRRSLRKTRDNSENHSALILWSVMPAFIGGLVLFGLYNFNIVLYFTLWFMITMIALAVGEEEKNIKVAISSSSLRAISTSLGFVLVLAFGLISGYLLIQKYTGEVYFAEASRINLNDRNQTDKIITFLDNAENKSNGDLKYLTTLSQALIIRINSELSNKTDRADVVSKRLQDLVKKAIDTSSKMTKDYKNDATSWLYSATIYQNLDSILTGADDIAVSSYQEYIKRAPNDPNGYLKIGTVYLNRAERNFSALADAKQKKLNIKNEKEVTNLIISDYNNAEVAFKKLIELKPDIALTYYNLGIIYERQNRLSEAIKQLEILAGAQLNSPSLAFELGLLYYRNNQKDKAFNEMVRAVSLFKDYSNARWYLALMLEEQGKISNAINQLNEILKLDVNKDNPIVLQKIASLEAGQREIPPAKVTSKKPL